MKNVLLASAALMTLGMAGSVNADEKAVSESVVVAPTSEKEVKPATEETKVAPKAEAVAEDTKVDDAAVEETTEKKAEVAPAAEFSKEYDAQVMKWIDRMVEISAGIDEVAVNENFDLEAFLKSYFFDILDLKVEVDEYTQKNGTSDQADALLQGINSYLDAVEPVMKELTDLGTKFYAGELTEAQLQKEIERVLMAAESEVEAEGNLDAVAPKQEETVAEKKAEVTPIIPEAGKPVVTEQTVATPTTVETLPETGSDAKSFISVIGAALAGLTVWGFGFKKRG